MADDDYPKTTVTCFSCKMKNDVPKYPSPTGEASWFPWVCTWCRKGFEYSNDPTNPFTREPR